MLNTSRSVVWDKRTNCSNTLYKFVKPEVEYVTQLNFFNPVLPTTSSFYNLKKYSTSQIQNEQTKKNFRSDSSNYEDFNTSYKLTHMRRLENINYETNLESRRKQIEDKIRDNKTNLKKLYKKLGNHKIEVQDLSIHVEFLENFYKYTGFEHRYNNSILKRNQDNDDYIKLIKMKKLESDKRETELRAKREELAAGKSIIINLKNQIDSLEHNNQIMKEDLDLIKNELLIHYHKLMAEGIDTRKDGLIWLIKAIWSLGCKVVTSYLPCFLDEKSITYLFYYSGKDLELHKLKKRKDDVHIMMRYKRENRIEKQKRKAVYIEAGNKSNGFGNTQLTFKTALSSRDDNIINTNNSEMLDSKSQIKTSVIHKLIKKQIKDNNIYEENLNIKMIKEMMGSRGELKEDALEYIRCITELEELSKNIKIEMQEIRIKELDRINKEFYSNDYERRFNVKQEVMIAALIGEDNAPNEMTRLKRDQKKYFQELANLRTYNIFQK